MSLCTILHINSSGIPDYTVPILDCAVQVPVPVGWTVGGAFSYFGANFIGYLR